MHLEYYLCVLHSWIHMKLNLVLARYGKERKGAASFVLACHCLFTSIENIKLLVCEDTKQSCLSHVWSIPAFLYQRHEGLLVMKGSLNSFYISWGFLELIMMTTSGTWLIKLRGVATSWRNTHCFAIVCLLWLKRTILYSGLHLCITGCCFDQSNSIPDLGIKQASFERSIGLNWSW